LARERAGLAVEARTTIERARPASAVDPDVLLAAAEVVHTTDPSLAVADLDAYLASVERLRTSGEAVNEARISRARTALERMRARSGDPFPALALQAPAEERAPRPAGDRVLRLIEIALVVALLARLAVEARARRANA